MKRLLIFSLAAACATARTADAPPATDAAQIFAQFKAATGGPAWDAVGSLELRGTLAAGGLTGPIVILQDVRTGRAASRYTLGSIQGAEGFDGKNAWSQDPGSESAVLDTPQAIEGAKTQAWLTAMGYWYPARAAAAFQGPEQREGFRIVRATPAGGHPIALWFDSGGLLVKTVEKQGADTVTTTLDDYRSAGSVRMPFHSITDRTDATGRTDPRSRSELRLDRVGFDVPLADAQFAPPAMAETAKIANRGGITRVPFELINNHIYVSASIGGQPVRMLVDTGGTNLLMPAAAARLGLVSEGKLAGGGVGSEKVDVGLVHAPDLRLGDAILDKPVLYVLDIGATELQEGTPADGLIGFEMFRRFRVTIDYPSRLLTLATKESFAPPLASHALPFELAERTPIVRGTLDGMPVRLTVDTGSRATLSVHSPFVREHKLEERYGAAPSQVVGWGVGGPAMGRPARLGALTLGDLTARDLAGDLHMDDTGAFANPDISGNLGGGYLRRFVVAFDYDAKQMYLVPKEPLDAPDPFDRSGLWLFSEGGALRIAAVAPGGPGEKAGLTKDQRIAVINGEPTAKRTLAEWRKFLRERPAGTSLALILVGNKKAELELANAIPDHARK
jgi:Aspartyl protease/PDZ domain